MFFSIPNLGSTVVTRIAEPWAITPEGVPDNNGNKQVFRDWCINNQTQHSFISCYEGLAPGIRVSYEQDNPPVKMHGLVVDYDAPISKEMLAKCKMSPPVEFMPEWAVETWSGNARLIWRFESPILLANKEHAKKIIVQLQKKLQLTKWLPGLDTEALSSPAQYYELGKWHRMKPGAVIPTNHLHLWVWEISKSISLLDANEQKYNIPLDKVHEAIEAKWPGRWKGPFAEGQRGVRFWDPDAKDPTGAIVMQYGMMAFSGEQAFISWRKLLGQSFVDKFEADRIGTVLANTVFDGRYFWIKQEDKWVDLNKDLISLHLKASGFSARKNQDGCSDIDKALHNIISLNRVERAMPFIHFPPDVISYEGERYLNTSKVKVLNPSPPITGKPMVFSDGKEHWPFIHNLLKTMFCEPKDVHNEQLDYLQAWLKYAYQNAYEGHPRPGQVIVLAGVAGKGKTLFLRKVVGGLLGGYVDAKEHIVSGVRWTDDVAKKPVWAIDDSLAATDQKSINAFNNRLKSYVSNSSTRFEAKYGQVGSVPFFGRIGITCNLDSESLRILPSLDISSRDKVSFFKTSDYIMDFPDWDTIDRMFETELPKYARFLLDWPYPQHTLSNEKRFGIKPFHQWELYRESQQQGLSGALLEVLVPFLKQWALDKKDNSPWEGTSAQLYMDLTAFNQPAMKCIPNSHGLGVCLGNLMRQRYKVEKKVYKLNTWVIMTDIFPDEDGEDTGKPAERR